MEQVSIECLNIHNVNSALQMKPARKKTDEARKKKLGRWIDHLIHKFPIQALLGQSRPSTEACMKKFSPNKEQEEANKKYLNPGLVVLLVHYKIDCPL